MTGYRPVAVTAALFAILGATGGLAAIRGRGAVEMGSLHFTGASGVIATALLFAAIGAALGLIVVILMRALSNAARGDRRKR